MSKQIYKNNSSSTLASGISSGATSLTLASGEGGLFASPSDDDWQMLTLSDGTAYEVVKMTGRTADVLTVARAQEGTAAAAWLTGATVQARLTAGMLDKIPVNTSTGASGIALGLNANSVSTGVVGFQTSTAVIAGQVLRVGDSICIVLVGGTTGASVPDPGITTYSDLYVLYVFTSGTAVLSPVHNYASAVSSTAMGAASHADENCVAVGQDATAASGSSVAIGKNAFAPGAQSVAIGLNAVAFNRGVAFGWRAKAFDTGVALGKNTMAKSLAIAIGDGAHTERSYQVTFSGHMMIGRDNWTAGLGSHKNSGAESAWSSHFVELGVPATWSGSTVYADGAVVRPTTPNGFQYRLWHGTYDTEALPNTITSYSVEPTWPTGIGDSVEADNPAVGDHYWIAADLTTGTDETIPAGMVFYPTEIGFICFNHSGVSAAPFVSIGTAAAPTLLVNNQQLSGITGASQRQAFTGFKDGITDLRIKLVTPATGASARFHGRFYAKGIFIQTQG